MAALVMEGHGLGPLSGPSVHMARNLLGVISEASLPVAGGWLGVPSMGCTAHSQERVVGIIGVDCQWQRWGDGLDAMGALHCRVGSGLGALSGFALPAVGDTLGALSGATLPR